MELTQLTITQAHQGLRNKKFSCLELVRSCLDKIKKEDKKIKAFLWLDEKKVLEEAQKVDEKIKKENFDVLTGIPLAIKDNICVKDSPTTAASKILKDYIPPYDATVIKRLKEKGALILGKTNLDEFAMGSSTENSAFFPTHNPYDLERVAGGSSGGSAAAVASGMSLAALGSDTGGSIRQPAAFCGVVGFKPSYGLVSRYGLIALTSSTDVIGPLTKTVEDALLILAAISGPDKKDTTSISKSVLFSKKELKKPLSRIKIGLPKEYFQEGLDLEIKEKIKDIIDILKKKNVQFQEVSLPSTSYALACYYIITPAEASSNLARFDGIRYGYYFPQSKNLTEYYNFTRTLGLGSEPKRRIILGTFVLSAGYQEAYYKKALAMREKIKNDFERVFKEVNFLFTPVAPTPAFKIGEKKDPLKMYLTDIYLVASSLAHLPALALPLGFNKENLPLALQIIGPYLADLDVLKLGYFIEKNIKGR